MHEEGGARGPSKAPLIPLCGTHNSQPSQAGQALDVTTPSDADQGGPKTDRDQATSAGTKGEGMTWGEVVRSSSPAVPPPAAPTAAQLRGAKMLKGVWLPLHVSQLTATLLTDWTTQQERTWTTEEQAMRALALESATARRDDCIRPWTPQENKTLVAYMGGELDLPHPPNFVKELMVAEHRAMLEDFHERYLNVALTINLPPTVRLFRNAPHAELFKEIFQANTDGLFGLDMMRVFQADVKRLEFDGAHTLTVVFYSRHAADRWVLKTLRFQRAVVTLQDTARMPGGADDGTYTAAQLDLQYALRVYGAGDLSLVAIVRAFKSFSGAALLDVEYARVCKTDIYDNRYHTVRFAQAGCPPALLDVTKIDMEGKTLLLHHFQTQLRRPCGRCFSPRHGGKRCNVVVSALRETRAQYSRSFRGEVDNVQPVSRSDYKVASAEKLVELLTSMQGDAVMQPETLLTPTDWQEGTSPPPEFQTGVDSNRSPVATDPSLGTASPRPVNAQSHQETEANGYTLHQSKGAKRAAKQAKKEKKAIPTDRPALKSSPAAKAAASDAKAGPAVKPIGRKKQGTGPPGRKTTAPSKVKGKAGPTRYEQFLREEINGFYGSLDAGGDKDNDEDEDGHMTDSAVSTSHVTPASTLPDSLAPRPPKPETLMTAPPAVGDFTAPKSQVFQRKTSESKRSGQDVANMDIKQQSMGAMADKMEKLVQTASAMKEKRRKQIDANRTGLGTLRLLAEEKSGLVQMSMARYMNPGVAVFGAIDEGERGLTAQADRQRPNSIHDEVVPATPDSQEEFTMGASRMGQADGDANLPTQVGQWLHSFNGHEVDVKANGHCAFLALYASTKNHPPGNLVNSATTVKHATQMKAAIYACMMANLRHDVALGLVDPISECKRIFPRQSPHTSVEAATAGLFAHYAHARDRTVDNWQPEEYWAGTHELRAMAQYLREPLLVLDANASNDAHIQRYLYKDFRLSGGSDHESGYVEALSDREAADYLRTCWSLHVMPTFLVLRRQERHFHGVGHGELWAKWQAEGDPSYTAGLPDAYEWKDQLNHLTEAEAKVDLTQLNMLEDTPEINTLIIKRVSNRDRLDVVHARRGLPTLDNTFLVAELDALLRSEESQIHAAYGADVYAAEMTPRQADSDAEESGRYPERFTRSATGSAVTQSYSRILRAADASQLDCSDMPLMELMQAENREAFGRWCNLYRTRLGIPTTRKRRADVELLLEWLLDNYVAMRHLFAFLPYPELEAKRWPIHTITTWGEAEIFCEQLRALLRITVDTTQPSGAREFCAEWHEACMVPGLDKRAAYTLASSPDRWARLHQWLPSSVGRARPADIPETDWRILHILPYVTEDWIQTPMGRAPHGARDLWYRNFAPVRQLCSGVATSSDWSTAEALGTSKMEGAVTETRGGTSPGASICD